VGLGVVRFKSWGEKKTAWDKRDMFAIVLTQNGSSR